MNSVYQPRLPDEHTSRNPEKVQILPVSWAQGGTQESQQRSNADDQPYSDSELPHNDFVDSRTGIAMELRENDIG